MAEEQEATVISVDIPWLKDTSDLPVMEKLLIVQDKEGTEWINLQMNPAWKEPKKRDEASFSANGKRIPYFIGSWLVSPSDLKKMLKIESPDYIWGDWFPELSNRYEVFSREFLWSQAWEFFDRNPYYRAQGLPQTIIDPITNEEIATVYHTPDPLKNSRSMMFLLINVRFGRRPN